MSTKKLIVIAVSAAVLLGIAMLAFRGERAVPQAQKAVFESFAIEGDDLVARGSGMERVEVWAVPTGTGVTDAMHQKLGDASQSSRGAVVQMWTLPIPQNPVLATEIYARGYGQGGGEARMSLPVTGATELYNALWLRIPSKEGALKVGETLEFEGLKLTLNKVVSDSRCPAGVQCIQAGNLTLEVTTASPAATQTQNVSSGAVGFQHENYHISIIKVSPEARQGGLQPSEYSVTFRIERDIKG